MTTRSPTLLNSPFVETWLKTPKLPALAILVSVFLASFAGIQFTRFSGTVAIVWLSDAIAIAIILRSSKQFWIPYIFFAYVGVFLADWLAIDPVHIAAMLAACNMVEVIVGVALFTRFADVPPDLSRPRDLIVFVLTCAVVAPILSAGSAALVLSNCAGADPLLVFQTWFAADALGVLVIAPLMLMLRPEEWRHFSSRANRLPALAILILFAAVTYGVFSQSHAPLLFLIYPFLTLAAFRLRFVGAAVATAILLFISVPLTLSGHGPLSLMVEANMYHRIALLQLLLAITVMTTLPVASFLDSRRKLEREALAARREAERANAAKSAFLANMSHELRTPMTGILGMCDLLLAGNQSPEHRNITETLEHSARSFLELLNDLLDLAKIESGRMSFQDADFRLSQLMKDVEEFFAPTMEQKRLEFSVSCVPGKHDVLYGDSKRLRQVLFNLVGNALKFTDKGSVVVTCRQDMHTDGFITT